MTRAFSTLLMSAIVIFAGLGVATAARALYEHWIQVPHCLEYARSKGLPDLEWLEVSEVSPASRRFPGHICHFTDTRTGAPVSLRFDEADVPYAQDTLQIICMVVPFVCVSVIVAGVWSLLAARFGKVKRTAQY